VLDALQGWRGRKTNCVDGTRWKRVINKLLTITWRWEEVEKRLTIFHCQWNRSYNPSWPRSRMGSLRTDSIQANRGQAQQRWKTSTMEMIKIGVEVLKRYIFQNANEKLKTRWSWKKVQVLDHGWSGLRNQKFSRSSVLLKKARELSFAHVFIVKIVACFGLLGWRSAQGSRILDIVICSIVLAKSYIDQYNGNIRQYHGI
jgi:hypothetical protein